MREFTDKFFDSVHGDILFEKFIKPEELTDKFIYNSSLVYVWKYISIGLRSRWVNPFKRNSNSYELAPEIGLTYKYFEFTYFRTVLKIDKENFPANSNNFRISMRYPIFSIKS